MFVSLLLLACSDYNLADDPTDVIEDGTISQALDDQSAHAEILPSETEESVDDGTATTTQEDSCTFIARLVETQEDIVTNTYPMATRKWDAEVNVVHGDFPLFTLELGAIDGCGSYKVREFALMIGDNAPQSRWIEDYIDGRTFADLGNRTAATNLGENYAPTGGYSLEDDVIVQSSLVYGWTTPESGWDVSGMEIPSQTIDGDQPQEMVFSFDTKYVPVGTTLVFTFFMGWDTMDGQRINPISFDSETLTVHIID